MKTNQHPGKRFAFRDFVLEVQEAVLTCRGEAVPLEPKEFDLLRVLLSNAGHLVHKDVLIGEVWPDTFVSDSSLLRNISILRKHLGYDAIRTVPRRGYVFVLPVEQLESVAESSSFAARPVQQGQAPPQEQDRIDALANRVNSSEDFRKTEDSTAVPSAGVPPQPGALEPRSNRRTISIRARAMLAVATFAAVVTLVAGIGWRHTPVEALGRTASRAEVPSKVAGGAWLFVLNEKGHSVSVVNPLSNTVDSTLLLAAEPRGAAILPNGPVAYISQNGANRVVAMNIDTHQIVATIPVGNNPVGVAANPRPPFVYVANNYSNTVSVIDSTTNTVVREVAVGSVPTEVAVNPDGTRAIVTNQFSGTVTVIDSIANSVLATIPVGASPVGVAFTPDSKLAWVTLAGQGEVAVIDLALRQVVRRVPVSPGPIRVVIAPDGRRVLVSNFFSNTVTVVDTASLLPIRTIAVGLNPVGLTFDPAGDLAYVANYGSNTISVIDMSSMAVVDTINVGAKPVEIAPLPCFTAPCDRQRAQAVNPPGPSSSE